MSNKRLIHGFHAINARLWQNPKSLLEIWLAGGRHDARAKAVLDKAPRKASSCTSSTRSAWTA